jgi:excisionase family DNA binding protein
MEIKPLFVTPAEAAKMLSVSRSKLYVLIREGKVPYWRTGEKHTWSSGHTEGLSQAEREALKKRIAAEQAKRDAAIREGHARAALKAAKLWSKAQPANPDHPYLKAKRALPCHPVRQWGQMLVLPIAIDGKLTSLQFIMGDGTKRFLTDGQLAGGYCALVEPDEMAGADTICVGEGFATCASIREASDLPVVVAFNCGNLVAVARAIAQHYPKARITVCADNDTETKGNPGVRHATEAARAVGALLAVAMFKDAPERKADFNDVMVKEGAASVRALLDAAAVPGPDGTERDHHTEGQPSGSVWDQAQTARDFCNAEIDDTEFVVPGLVAKGVVTVMASPRGLGKTHIALALVIAKANGGVFCGHRLTAGKVLLLDRDNPRSEIRRRIKAWGGGELTNLKVMHRNQVPALTDAKAWGIFPFKDYELVLLDSLSAAMENVKDGDGGENGRAFAALLDLARKGPGVLVLANTRKDEMVLRGSGVIADRLDIIYEVRDGTDIKLLPGQDTWLDCVPQGTGFDWTVRSKRRSRRDAYRLAFTPSKFRVGEEPAPFMLEIRLPAAAPWSIRDVTADLEMEMEAAKGAAATAKMAKDRAAVTALMAKLPLTKAAAVELLKAQGFSRDAARRFIEDQAGHDWIIAGDGTKKDPYRILADSCGSAPTRPSAGIAASKEYTESTVSDHPIPAAYGTEGPQESESKNDSAARGSDGVDSCGRSGKDPNPQESEGAVRTAQNSA